MERLRDGLVVVCFMAAVAGVIYMLWYAHKSKQERIQDELAFVKEYCLINHNASEYKNISGDYFCINRSEENKKIIKVEL